MSVTRSMSFDLKEDLRHRMMDLEKKLSESEEERSKMEKRCNALIRSFREEERMRCIALNKKYEKFLQDCTVRKRRNEIILRSLRRIEDRSKALFAKTERLKLLKDRQISYLKISDVKKDEVFSQFSESSQKVDNDVVSKSVHWKTPLATDQKKKQLDEIVGLFRKRISDEIPSRIASDLENHKELRSEEVQRYEGRKNSESIVLNQTFHSELPQNKLNLVKMGSDFFEPLAENLSIHFKSEKLPGDSDEKKLKNDCASKHETLGGKFNDKNLLEISRSVMNHQESIENLEKALSLKKEHSDNENSDKKLCSVDGKIEKDDIESNEKSLIRKQNNSQNELFPRISHPSVPFRSFNVTHDAEEQENMSKNAGEEMKASYQKEETLKSLPMGLDGIDYQNETYPESYYEQPVYHHNHTNIAADVILEEDETEQDGEEENKENEDITTDYNFGKTQIFCEDSHTSSSWVHSPRNRIPNESNLKSATNKDYAIDTNCFDEPYGQNKSQKSDSERNSEAEQSDLGSDKSKKNKNESLIFDIPDKNKPPVKSSLIHLLESDSESYQIEHGDGVSENEVSDFDLSFQ